MPSTAIRQISYDDVTRIMFVTFTSGDVYAYLDVPPAAYSDFRGAFSKGRHFAKHVRDRYAYRQLAPQEG